MYSAVRGFWPVRELADLADGPTGRGEVSKGWVFVCLGVQCDEFNPITVAERRTRPIMTCRCVSDSLLAYGLKIPPAKNRALHYDTASSQHRWLRERATMLTFISALSVLNVMLEIGLYVIACLV